MKIRETVDDVLWGLALLCALKNYKKEIKNMNLLLQKLIMKAQYYHMYRALEYMDRAVSLRIRKNNAIALKEGAVRAFKMLDRTSQKLLYALCIQNQTLTQVRESLQMSDTEVKEKLAQAALDYCKYLKDGEIFDKSILKTEDWIVYHYPRMKEAANGALLSSLRQSTKVA